MSTKYDILRTYTYRHQPSLVVSHNQMLLWKSRPPKFNVWFLVEYRHLGAGHYNIEVRTIINADRATLAQIVTFVHTSFLDELNQDFARNRIITHRDKHAEHLVAIEPVQNSP